MFLMKSLASSIAFAFLLTPALSFGAAGMYDNFVFTSTNGGALAFYDIGAVTVNPDFNTSNLGTFVSGTTFQVGAQQKSFKNNGTDVSSHSLLYRVWLTSGGASGTFTSVSMPFQWNFGDAGAPAGLNSPGDQQWGGDSQGANGNPIEISSNVLSGLANGSYTLEVFSQITTNSVNSAGTLFNNNGGSNYRATFTLVPEPSRALLLGFGAIGLLVRRRR